MELSFWSHLDSNKLKATKVCTWHDSCAVVACAKLCYYLRSSNWIKGKRSFHGIWIARIKITGEMGPCWSAVWTSCRNYEECINCISFKIITLRPRQHGRHFADGTSKHIFSNEHIRTSINISLKFVLKGPINHIPALVQIMTSRRQGDKSLSEPVLVSLLSHICVIRPQWVICTWCMYMSIKNMNLD